MAKVINKTKCELSFGALVELTNAFGNDAVVEVVDVVKETSPSEYDHALGCYTYTSYVELICLNEEGHESSVNFLETVYD